MTAAGICRHYSAGRTGRGPLWRGAAAVLIAVTLSGCVGTRFIYNQLDWFVTWQIAKYFDLDKEQREQLRSTVESALEWVRTEQLPAYAELLRAVAREAGTGELTTSRWQAIYDEMIVLYDDFLRQVVPGSAAWLATLSDEQVQYLMDKLGEENEELREEYSGSTPEERQLRRGKAIIKGMQRFTGRLSGGQKDMVRAAVNSMYDNSEEWLEGRRLWQQAFRSLLLERPPPAEFEARLLAISLDPNYVDRPEYRAQVEANQRIVLELMANIVVSLDDKQRERFQRRVNGFADDFDALALRAENRLDDGEPDQPVSRQAMALSAS